MHKFFANSLFLGKKVEILPHCHSTNEVAVEMLVHEKLPEGTIIITEDQTKGKGQRGNQWESEPGKNLTFSLVLYPKSLSIKDQFYLNMITSLGICSALRNFLSSGIKVKWPNDVYVNNRKICGILVENALKGSTIEQTVIGIGLNVNQTEFIVEKATSMADLTLMNYDLNEVFDKVVQSIEKYYLQLKHSELKSIRQDYLDNLYWMNELHVFDSNGVFSGQIVDIDENGKLVVESNNERAAYDIREISFIK